MMISMQEQQDSKIRKILFNEVSLIIAICGIILGGFIYLTDPSKSNTLALALQNARITEQQRIVVELTKTQQDDIKEVKNETTGMRNEIQFLTNNIIKLQTIIEERIPNPRK